MMGAAAVDDLIAGNSSLLPNSDTHLPAASLPNVADPAFARISALLIPTISSAVEEPVNLDFALLWKELAVQA